MDLLLCLEKIVSDFRSLFNQQNFSQGYLVLGFLSILSEKSRFGDRSYSGNS